MITSSFPFLISGCVSVAFYSFYFVCQFSKKILIFTHNHLEKKFEKIGAKPETWSEVSLDGWLSIARGLII